MAPQKVHCIYRSTPVGLSQGWWIRCRRAVESMHEVNNAFPICCCQSKDAHPRVHGVICVLSYYTEPQDTREKERCKKLRSRHIPLLAALLASVASLPSSYEPPCLELEVGGRLDGLAIREVFRQAAEAWGVSRQHQHNVFALVSTHQKGCRAPLLLPPILEVCICICICIPLHE